MSLTMVVSSLRKGGWEVEEREKEKGSSANTKNDSTLLLALYVSHTLIYTMVTT